MIYKIHKLFAFISFFIILIFFTSTLFVEVFFDYKTITQLKALIVCPGLFILLPSIAITAISGNIIAKRSKNSELIKIKKKRMPFIAIIGVFVLIPCAIYLNYLATENLFDTTFFIVQSLELLAGAINLSLMFLNIKDSKRLSTR